MPSGGPDSPQPGAQPQYLAPATHAQGGREQAETLRRNSPRPLTGGVSPYRFSLCAVLCGVNVHGVGGVPISSPGRAAYAPRLWHAREMTAARGLDTPAMPCRTSRRAKSVLGALLEQIEGGCSRQAVRATRPRLGGIRQSVCRMPYHARMQLVTVGGSNFETAWSKTVFTRT